VYCDQQVGTAKLDSAKVQQMLVNLLSNAAKFTTHGTITLRVSIDQATIDRPELAADHSPESPDEEPGAHSSPAVVTFEIADTGIGIAPNQLPQLFQPFTHNDIRDARTYGGIGLGLVICQRYCQLMGGDLTVTSQLGQGSTFTVHLPIGSSIATFANAGGAPSSARSASADDRSH
jgi:signal transduction histidine kinase